MEDFFKIPVLYNNEELFFTARLIPRGYIHQFEVEVYGQVFFFEQDDEGEYRAMGNPANQDEKVVTDRLLLKEIAASIAQILK